MASKSVLDTLVQIATIEITQGGADALITGQIQTGISTAATYGWMIESIEVEVKDLLTIPLATDQEIIVQIAKGAQAALIDFDDDDLITAFRQIMPTIAGSVGNPILKFPWRWDAPSNFVIADPIVSVLMDSTATGLTLTGRARIYYFPVSLTELDLLRLLAS